MLLTWFLTVWFLDVRRVATLCFGIALKRKPALLLIGSGEPVGGKAPARWVREGWAQAPLLRFGGALR